MGTPINIIVGSQVWAEDPEVAWIDGEVIEIKGSDATIVTTNGKTIVADICLQISQAYTQSSETPQISLSIHHLPPQRTETTLHPSGSISVSDRESVSNPYLGSENYGVWKAVGRIPVGVGRRRLRIVVTGGAEFVGSHLVDRLIARGDDVILIDNFFTGRKENVMHHFGDSRFELIRHDVVEPILLEVDQIYHLVCPASPVHYKHNPIKTNVMGTLNMLGLAKRIGARFFYYETSEVYGDPLEHPQKETYRGHVNPIGVRSCYDEGKRTAENLTMDYHRGAGVLVLMGS
ncbi:hypothetical protein ACSBR1_016238 [Camellia fascicularis]